MNDFERIKKNSQLYPLNISFTPHNNCSGNNLIPNESLNLKQMKAIELKKRIISYDKAKKDEAQNAELARYSSMINQSKKEMEKGEDSVRAMDKLILYAKIATIRDLQLEERSRLEEESRKKDEKLEVMMEIKRLQELSCQETKEISLKKQRKDGCKIIIDQIKDNEREKSLQKAVKHQQGIEMIKNIQALEKEDRIKAEEAKKRSMSLYKDAIAANQKAIAEKEKLIVIEKENDMKIFQYKLQKDKQEEEKIKEKKRLQEEKELDVQKLREAQEKAHDLDEELNSIRARRAYEVNERRDREKIANDLSIKARRIKDFLASNDQQRLNKEIVLAEQSKQERIFSEQIVEQQQKDLEKEKKSKEEYRRKLYEHNDQLRRQIKEREERERITQIEKYEEGMQMKKDHKSYMKYLLEKKGDKIKELINLNLKPSYLVDLKKFKIDS